MSKLEQLYNSYSNSQLLEVINNKASYEPEAVKLARTILESRELSSEDYVAARKENRKIQSQLKNYRTNNSPLKKSASHTLNLLYGKIRLFLSNLSYSDKSILWISIVFGILSISSLITNIDLLYYVWEKGITNIRSGDLELLLTILLLPVSVSLFWSKQKLGWILLCFYSLNEIALSVIVYIMDKMSEPTGILFIDELSSQNSIADLLPVFLLYGSALWALNTESLKNVFNVSTRTFYQIMFATMAIVIIRIISL